MGKYENRALSNLSALVFALLDNFLVMEATKRFSRSADFIVEPSLS